MGGIGMNIFKADKIMDRLNKMLENAINGKPVETSFDESKMSTIETKLQKYLKMTGTSRDQLAEEKMKINQLISDISHQTKTPIANIMIYSQLLAESNLSEQDKMCVEALTQQTEKLNFLIASLVKASRLENGVIAVTPKLQGIQPMLDSVISQISAKAEQRKIRIDCKPTDAKAMFDLKWTGEALYNMLDNGVKYTPAGGHMSISVTTYQLFCRIDIRDTGIGISEDEQSKVFTRFYRSPAISDSEGIGIGLYLAREIISSEGGYIKLDSKIGNGSTFSVFLPMES